MNSASDWKLWWLSFGPLVFEVALIVGLAALVASRVRTAFWRRTTWQASVVALLGVLSLELSGGAPVIAAFTASKTERKPSAVSPIASNFRATSTAPVPRDLQHQAERSNPAIGQIHPPSKDAGQRRTPLQLSPATSSPLNVSPVPPSTPQLLAGAAALLWLGGALTFLVLNSAARLRFTLRCRRSPVIVDAELNRRVAELITKIGLRRPVRLFESRRDISPVAAGVLWPAIGLPPRFTRDYTPEQQDVMLAHELAHLAARDPFWYLLADVVAALLWWHPLAWWARRRLHAASETAADEASHILHDGPRVLAECLVALGGRLTRSHTAAISVKGTGFRSSLARRVQRLLDAPARPWTPPHRLRAALARTLVPAVLVVAVIFCAAQTIPQPTNTVDPMKNINHSLPLWALLSAIGTAELPAVAADAPKPTPPPAAKATSAAPPKPVPAPVARTEGAAKFAARLNSIILEEVRYDSLPLGEVVNMMIRDTAARDPDKLGVNFLFGQPANPINPPATIDPATGLPVTAPAPETPDLSAVAIRIEPPLRKVRLSDALDAIKRVADVPITYTIEEYAVVFTLDTARINKKSETTPPPAPTGYNRLDTRIFNLNTNAFFASLNSMFRVQIEPTSEQVAYALRTEIFPKLGVKWNEAENLALYNSLTGALLVRASAADMETIVVAIEALGGTTTPAADPTTTTLQLTLPGQEMKATTR